VIFPFMKPSLYRLRIKTFRLAAFKILVGFLIFSLVSPTLYAQQMRRGVFLQDELPSQNAPSEGEMETTDQTGLEGTRVMPGRMESERGMVYQIHVLGEVAKPGTYRVSPSMRVTDALKLAGNIKGNGSERFVELRKIGQKKGRVLDLFAYKTLGQLAQNPYLQDNDTIFVPLKEMAVEIEGPVHRPGVFELKNERSLNDIIDLAGGFTVGVSQKETIKVVRYGGNQEKQIHDIPINPTDMQNFRVQDGDVIFVPHKFLTQHTFDYNVKRLPNDNIFYPAYESRVFVIGAVRAPGAFEFNQYYTLNQYLTLAGGTTTMAKNGQIKVMAVDGKSYKAKNAIYNREVNPGDTIVVPEKSIPVTFWIGLMPTIASLGLSSVALFRH
jgi:protein involved in polysaccharide export with SLBB domain